MRELSEILGWCEELIAVKQEGAIVFANEQFQKAFPTPVDVRRVFEGGAEFLVPTDQMPHVNGCRVLAVTTKRTVVFGEKSADLLILRDCTDQRWLELEMVRISNSEKERIAQDLHDGIGQEVTAIKFQTHALALSLQDSVPVEAKAAEEIVESLRVTAEHIRDLSHILDPSIENQSLGALLLKLARSTEQFFRIICKCSVTYDPLLPKDVMLHLQRIAQEAVANARRHGSARRVQILLTRAGSGCLLVIKDDGDGFQREHVGSGIGIRTMQARAAAIGARLDIAAGETGGTSVTCFLPDR